MTRLSLSGSRLDSTNFLDEKGYGFILFAAFNFRRSQPEMLVDSMTRLSGHIADNEVHQLSVYNCLAVSDLKKLIANLSHQEQVIRKASMKFLCLLLARQQQLKDKFLAALNIMADAGYIVLNNFPVSTASDKIISIMRHLKLRSRILTRLSVACRQRMTICWYMRLDHPELVHQVFKENISVLDQLDPQEVLFGFISFPQKSEENARTGQQKAATDRVPSSVPFANISNVLSSTNTPQQIPDLHGKDTFRRRIITHNNPATIQQGTSIVNPNGSNRERYVTVPVNPTPKTDRADTSGQNARQWCTRVTDPVTPINAVPFRPYNRCQPRINFQPNNLTLQTKIPVLKTPTIQTIHTPVEIPKLVFEDFGSQPNQTPKPRPGDSKAEPISLKAYPKYQKLQLRFRTERQPPTKLLSKEEIREGNPPRMKFEHKKISLKTTRD